MIIQRLVLTNYRVYSGINEFDLSPRKRYGKTRPIVLFGGLNGAGKTSILNGVRLALYGRASLPQRTSLKNYEEFLSESIHRSKNRKEQASSASVEVAFTYAKLGVESNFRVTRSWDVKKNKVQENLEVLENEVPVKGLDQQQAQNFLNELIPIGVSDLFFFDGEKISQLADSTGGSVLEQSIKNLLGLDVVERLEGDLNVLSRQLIKSSSRGSLDQEIDLQESLLQENRNKIENIRQEISIKSSQIAEKKQQAHHIQKLLNDRGSFFSTSRKDLEQELDSLNLEKDRLSQQAILLIGDAVPFCLPVEFVGRVADQIEKDLVTSSEIRDWENTEKAVMGLVKELEKKIDSKSFKIVSSEATALSKKRPSAGEVVHDLTPSQAGKVLSTIETSKNQLPQLIEYFDKIEKIEQRTDEIIAALSRAPDDVLVKNDFENLQIVQKEIGKKEAELDALRDSARVIANAALEIAKKLDKLYTEASKTSDQKRVIGYISNSGLLLSEYVQLTAAKKIKELEDQFTQCFSRLARKSDLSLSIEIDPKTYNVSLLSGEGRKIGNDEISAGEKQIFAISMLEALAKTSGRQLPMIVDTPLGRLDSKHRQKLIEGYFPTASHQMVVLSTDTEVDENFYRSLSPDIARAYKLEYNSQLGATEVEEGYFWQTRQAS